MKKHPGRKELRRLARANRRAQGKKKMAIHNWKQKIKSRKQRKGRKDEPTTSI